MIQFQIICVGSIKEKYFSEGIGEYQKRIQKFAKLEIIEIPESRLNDHPSPKQIDLALEEEALKITEKLQDSRFIITLEINGTSLTSEGFAEMIDKLSIYESSKISFVIGSSYGLANSLKNKSNFSLSFSQMTYPHQMMRLILLEQIYRALTILNHVAYHK